MGKKVEPELVCIQVKCSCGQLQTFAGDNLRQISWGVTRDILDIGSHGRAYLSYTCGICKKYQELELTGW